MIGTTSSGILDELIYAPYASAVGMMLHIYGKFTMGKVNRNHLFCRKVRVLTGPHCKIQGIGQGMKQT